VAVNERMKKNRKVQDYTTLIEKLKRQILLT
jgi:hypothetical protein